MKLSFIIVDNNELHCFIACKLINQAAPGAAILTFMEAREALEYIAANPADSTRTIVLLDLVMPGMNGFQFIETFEKLPREVQDNYFIVALTSTMNKKCLIRLKSYSTVRQLLDKPVTIENIYTLIGQ